MPRAVPSLWALVLLAVAGLPSPVGSADIDLRIIVHPDVPGTHVPREDLSAIFLKDEGQWADGEPVVPVDQSLRSPVRATFTEHVLGERPEGVQALWARKIARGVTPPVVKASDQEVIAFVARTRGAVGYVSLDASLPPTVRILSVLY